VSVAASPRRCSRTPAVMTARRRYTRVIHMVLWTHTEEMVRLNHDKSRIDGHCKTGHHSSAKIYCHSGSRTMRSQFTSETYSRQRSETACVDAHPATRHQPVTCSRTPRYAPVWHAGTVAANETPARVTESCDSGAPGHRSTLINNETVDTITIATGTTERKEGNPEISRRLTRTGAGAHSTGRGVSCAALLVAMSVARRIDCEERTCPREASNDRGTRDLNGGLAMGEPTQDKRAARRGDAPRAAATKERAS
jgi:hypothetical protein